jgi:ribosome modulation factor
MERREIELEGARACGGIAYRGKLAMSDNPYHSPDLREAWLEGWRKAEGQAVADGAAQEEG